MLSLGFQLKNEPGEEYIDEGEQSSTVETNTIDCDMCADKFENDETLCLHKIHQHGECSSSNQQFTSINNNISRIFSRRHPQTMNAPQTSSVIQFCIALTIFNF